eukprot:scaffold1394_cov12-Tisochrysis_lutea.AAC.1
MLRPFFGSLWGACFKRTLTLPAATGALRSQIHAALAACFKGTDLRPLMTMSALSVSSMKNRKKKHEHCLVGPGCACRTCRAPQEEEGHTKKAGSQAGQEHAWRAGACHAGRAGNASSAKEAGRQAGQERAGRAGIESNGKEAGGQARHAC